MSVGFRYRGTDAPTSAVQRAFLHAAPMDPAPNPQGHCVLCDPEFRASCGYAAHDEADLLHLIAAALGPAAWLEVGSHTGWTAAHLASAWPKSGGHGVLMLDPEYETARFNDTGSAVRFRVRTLSNLARAGVLDRCTLVGQPRAEFVGSDADSRYAPHGYGGVFIDGCHEDPHPIEDAKAAAARLGERGVVVLHDGVGWPVRRAARWLMDHGFACRVYRTPQVLIVLWRGRFRPPPHKPDLAFPWRAWLEEVGSHGHPEGSMDLWDLSAENH